MKLEVFILFSVLSVTWAAYKGDTCPSPCRCFEFFGVQSAYCNGTGIKSVPRGIPNNTQLLDISYNPISFIKVGDIEQLPNLEYIVIMSNKYTEGSIEAGALDLPKLTNVDLGDNAYTSIPNIFPEKITTLIMSYNNIALLKSDSFNKYSALKLIDLTNNKIGRIEEGTFSNLFQLAELRLPFNHLTNDGMPPNVFFRNLNLTQISLGYNNLNQLLKNLPASVQIIDYSANNITTIRSYAFSSTPNLQALDFLNGKVTTIEDNAFFGLSKMITLDFLGKWRIFNNHEGDFQRLDGFEDLVPGRQQCQ